MGSRRQPSVSPLSSGDPTTNPSFLQFNPPQSVFNPNNPSQLLANHTHIPYVPFQHLNSQQLLTSQKRHLMGWWQNISHMDWDRLSRNYQHLFVWLEEYKLGRYRADKKRIIFHARRSGGIQPPFDHQRGEYMDDWEYLEVLRRERRERFRRLNVWRKSTVIRRWALQTVFTNIVSFYNNIQDRTTRFIGYTAISPRFKRFKDRRFWRYMFFLPFRYPLQQLLRITASLFLRLEMTRIWTLRDLDFHMQNRVSGEMYAKYNFPVKYSISKYLVALAEPMFNTFNYFHGARLVVLNVIWPLILRWWHHINTYKPYVGFMKFGLMQFIFVVFGGVFSTGLWTRYQWLDYATYSYKADYAHTYIALMTRAIYAESLISMIEDGLIQVDELTQGHDFEMHTKMKSEEYKFIDDEINRRCAEDPKYREQLKLEGIPVTLDEFYGIEGIPTHLAPKEQVLFILRQYTDYAGVTREMLKEMRAMKEFIEKYLHILYSLGLTNETSWRNKLMGNIASPKTFLYSYRALLNVIGTRDGDTDDPSVQHHAMIRALTRKFDLTILPPNQSHLKNMSLFNRNYVQQFQKIPWDRWAFVYKFSQAEGAQRYHDDRPGMNLDVYHGADKSTYDPIKHGEHQFYNNLPSVTNGYNHHGNKDGIGGFSDINLKGMGRAFFDPYLSVVLPSLHARPLDHEMVVLQQIKEDLISLARISPEFKDEIPLEYDPYGYKHYIQAYLRVFGAAKLQTWEKMMGRDFLFETPDLMMPTTDIKMNKHAKWLWATVLSCVTEKIEFHWFVSPMYYIEGTCPELEASPYRSKVDTVSRFMYKNEIGRPVTEFQRRGIDYQMVDPYAEENVGLIKQYKHHTNYWDFFNQPRLDPRVDDMYKSTSEDMGFWPGGQSHLPFLGVNKYRGSNPMTGYIGMLATCCENLMTVNRTAKDIMIETGTDQKFAHPMYDPFGPQFRHPDGEYRNYPLEGDISEEGVSRFILEKEEGLPSIMESDPIVHAQFSNKTIIPSHGMKLAATFAHQDTNQSIRDRFQLYDETDDEDGLFDSSTGHIQYQHTNHQYETDEYHQFAETIATRDPSSPSIGMSSIQQQHQQRSSDSFTQRTQSTPSSSTPLYKSSSNQQGNNVNNNNGQPMQDLPQSLLAIARQQRSQNTSIHELRESEVELLHRLKDSAGSGTGSTSTFHQINRSAAKIHKNVEINPEQHFQNFLSSSTMSQHQRDMFEDAHLPPQEFDQIVNPLVTKYNKALELHQADPSRFPHPLAPHQDSQHRQPYERAAFRENSAEEAKRF